MRKEFLIAIISGVAIGLIVAFGIWRANTAFKPENSVSSEKLSSENKESNPEITQLAVIRPEKDDVITVSPVKVSGITKPQTTLLISGESKDYILKSNEDGSFEQEVELVGGVNEILLATDDVNFKETKSLRVIFSTEFGEVSE